MRLGYCYAASSSQDGCVKSKTDEGGVFRRTIGQAVTVDAGYGTVPPEWLYANCASCEET